MGIVPPEMLSFSYAVGIPDEGWFGLQVSVMDLTLWSGLDTLVEVQCLQHLLCYLYIHLLLKILAFMTSIWIITQMCLF